LTKKLLYDKAKSFLGFFLQYHRYLACYRWHCFTHDRRSSYELFWYYCDWK